MRATTGVRLVLANCADPAREAEFNRRYDAYAAALTEPGHFVTAARFAAVEASRTEDLPRYAALYDIALDDPGRAWPLTRDHSSRVVGPLSALLDVKLRATYVSLRRSAPAERPQEITLVLSDEREGVDRRQVEDWCRTVPDRTVFALVEGSPKPPHFLEVLAAVGPSTAQTERSRLLQPRLCVRYRRLFWHRT